MVAVDEKVVCAETVMNPLQMYMTDDSFNAAEDQDQLRFLLTLRYIITTLDAADLYAYIDVQTLFLCYFATCSLILHSNDCTHKTEMRRNKYNQKCVADASV